jgi:hypothetical protein
LLKPGMVYLKVIPYERIQQVTHTNQQKCSMPLNLHFQGKRLLHSKMLKPYHLHSPISLPTALLLRQQLLHQL